MKPPRSREEARRLGFTRYRGNPCKRGHSGERYTLGGMCVVCIALQRTKGKIEGFKQRKVKYKSNKTYTPDKPCRYGHRLRWVGTNNCVLCDKTALTRHKRKRQFTRLTKLYGLTEGTHALLVKKQKGRCALCGKKPKTITNLHVDHCHESKRVRGLLCGKCNQGIGLLQEDPKLLRKAAHYVCR